MNPQGPGGPTMQFLDRVVNHRFEAACLGFVMILGFAVGWHYALDTMLVMLLAGAGLKIARTDRGVSTLYKGALTHRLGYHYPGTRRLGKKPHMGKLTIRSRNGQPFTALIGVEVNMPVLGVKFHPFGHVESNAKGEALVRTWLGRRPVTFLYLTSIPANEIDVYYNPDHQHLPEGYTNWPHLIQLFL